MALRTLVSINGYLAVAAGACSVAPYRVFEQTEQLSGVSPGANHQVDNARLAPLWITKYLNCEQIAAL